MISEPIESSKRKEKQKFRLLRLNKWLIILIVLLLLGGVSWVIYRQIVVLPKQEAKRSQQTITAAKENLTVTVSANGTVQPEMAINISPKTSGILKKLFVKEGDLVKQGQLLAKMDDSNLQGQLLQYRGQLAQSEANLEKLIAGNRPQDIAQAQAELAQAEANLEKLIAGNRPQEIAQAQARLESALSSQRQTEIIFGQNQQLYRDGAISQREWETSHSEWDSAQAKVKIGRAHV